MRLPRMMFVPLCFVLAAAACDDDDDDQDPIVPAPDAEPSRPDAAVAPEVADIGLSDDEFLPDDITITVGTTVRWTNNSSIAHTVTSGNGSSSTNAGAVFDVDLASGAQFEWTYNAVGEFPYFCRIHEAAGMTGMIRVTQ